MDPEMAEDLPSFFSSAPFYSFDDVGDADPQTFRRGSTGEN